MTEWEIEQLKPCPFCGGKPFVDSCDRLIEIGCKSCGYYRVFHGIIQSEFQTGVAIPYSDGTISGDEWYDKDANEKAIEAWNNRAGEAGETKCLK